MTIAASVGDHQSGRLIVFVERVDPRAKPSDAVDFNAVRPDRRDDCGARGHRSPPGPRVATIDAETDAFPSPLSKLAPGRYRIQAVLDRNHDYAYNGRGAGDLVSSIVTVTLPGAIPTVTLEQGYPRRPIPAPRPELAKYYSLVRADRVPEQCDDRVSRYADLHSRLGRACRRVMTAKTRFPTVYSDGGFGSSAAIGETRRREHDGDDGGRQSAADDLGLSRP